MEAVWPSETLHLHHRENIRSRSIHFLSKFAHHEDVQLLFETFFNMLNMSQNLRKIIYECMQCR